MISFALATAHVYAAPHAVDASTSSGASASTGAQDAKPVRLSVTTTLCADGDAFWSALGSRSPHIRPAAAGEAAPVVEIEIARSGRQIVGRMRMAGGGDTDGEPPATRTVAGASCDEVVSSMTLMTALVFDAAADAPPEDPIERTAEPSPRATAPVAAAEGSWSWAGGGQALLSSEGAWGGGLFAEVQRVSREHRVSAWLPALRLGAGYARLDRVAAPARAAVEWRTVQVDACPWRAAPFRRWTLRPCASLEGGALDVSADGIADARSLSRPWLALGAQLRSTWTLVGPVELGFQAAAVFPVLRDEFKVAPALSLYRAPVAQFGTGISIGMRFL